MCFNYKGVVALRAKRSGKTDFQVESWNSHRKFIGMSDDDCKKKFGCLAKPAAPRGPKPVKNAIFEDIKKKELSKKSLQNWLESQEGSTIGYFLNDFFGTRGHTWGGGLPLLRKSLLIKVKETFSLKIRWVYPWILLKNFLGTLGDPKGFQKKIRLGAPFSGYPGTPKHCPILYYQLHNFKLKKSMIISLDFA